jgi:hypothetical protein
MVPLLGACSHYVPVIPAAVACEVPEALMQDCEAPAVLAEGLNFGQLLQTMQLDRQNLQRCAVQQADLSRAVRSCQAQISQHNQKLAEIGRTVRP